MRIEKTREIIIDPRFPSILFIGLIRINMRYVIPTTIIIDKIVANSPFVSNNIITAVIAPGPTNSGNANGTHRDLRESHLNQISTSRMLAARWPK